MHNLSVKSWVRPVSCEYDVAITYVGDTTTSPCPQQPYLQTLIRNLYQWFVLHMYLIVPQRFSNYR